MNIRNYLNKYSFNFFANICWLLLFILVIMAFASIICIRIDSGYIQVLFWYIAFFFPTVVFPVTLTIFICIYKFLSAKELSQNNFRIKNKFVTDSTFYLIFTLVSLILTFLLILTFVCVNTYIIFLNTSLFYVFLYAGIPLMIVITIIYHFIRKKFLQN